MQIEAYQFGDAERLRFGKYPALDTVLYRWARGIEESVFAELGQEAYVGASVVEEMRFSEFFRSLKRPRPIYFFTLDPFPGQGLLVLDNRFANACLYGSQDGGPAGGQDALHLTPANQERLQRIVHGLLGRWDEAWAGVVPSAAETGGPVHARLTKVTTYLFRARAMPAYEPCLVAQLHLSGARLSARLMVCLPRLMLAGVVEHLQRVPVIPAVTPPPLVSQATVEGLLGPAVHAVTATMGTVSVTLGPEEFRVGSVLPIDPPAGGQVVLDVNGTPLLVGEMGDSHGRYAVRVTGTYPAAPAAPVEPPPFRPILWPDAAS